MKIRKSMKTLLLLVAVTVLTCGAGIVVSFSQKQEAKTQKQQEREKRREHLNWYARSVYRGLLDPTQEKIPDRIASLNRDIRLDTDVCRMLTLNPFAPPRTDQEILNEQACDVDAIIIGTVKTQTSRLTEDETFIYTVNEMDVTTVLKDNLAQSIKPGDHINVLRRGGRLEVKGRKAQAVSYASLWLEADRTYLLFLSFVPEKGFYVTTSVSCELRDNKMVTKGPVDPWLKHGQDANSYIESLRAAAAAPCDD